MKAFDDKSLPATNSDALYACLMEVNVKYTDNNTVDTVVTYSTTVNITHTIL